MALGYLGGQGSSADSDWYTVDLAAGQKIVVSTATPFDNPNGLPGNALDPKLALLDPSGNQVAADDNSLDGKNARVSYRAPQAGTYYIVVTAAAGAGPYVLDLPNATIAGRHIFYNASAWDWNLSADTNHNGQWDFGEDGPLDNLAIAADKVPLLPGGTATLANYTSYSLGIDGVMVDVQNMPGTPTAADFAFAVGNSNDPSSWAAAPQPATVTVLPGQGDNGSTRVEILWAANAVQKEWLQVTVLATPQTGLASPDVFYWGNAIGETGNSSANAFVNGIDGNGVRQNSRNFLHPARSTSLMTSTAIRKSTGPTTTSSCRTRRTSSLR